MENDKIWYCTYSMMCNVPCSCHHGGGFSCYTTPICSSHKGKARFVTDKFLVIVRTKIEKSKKLNSKRTKRSN